MSAGQKPVISISARRKDAPKGSKDRVKLGSAWPGKFPGAYNLKFDDIAAIKMKDGTVISVADHWFDLKNWSEADGGGRGTSSGGRSSGGFSSDGDSEIPFRAAPRTAKDIA